MRQAHVPSPDEIWKILRETSLNQKETSRQMKEADRRFQKSKEEADRRFQKSKEEADRRFQKSKEEADRRMKEFDKSFQKSREEADRRMKEFDKSLQKSREEADRRMKEFDKSLQKSREEADRLTEETKRIVQETALQIKQAESRWGNQWGILIEALIKGDLVRLLNKRGLKVRKVVPNYTGIYGGKAKEFDLIAADGTEIVVVETKSHLSKQKTDQFLKVMADFKKYCPEFSFLTVYAGIACLRARPETLSYAENRGLFVIQISGQNAVMLNKKAFRPKVFCPDSKKQR